MNTGSREEELLARLQQALQDEDGDDTAMGRMLCAYDPADIALALEELEPDEAKRAFATLNEHCSALVLGMLAPELTSAIAADLDVRDLERFARILPNRDAAALLAEQAGGALRDAPDAAMLDSAVRRDVKMRLDYPEASAGRMMTGDFIRLDPSMTVEEALEAVRRSDPAQDIPNVLCAVERDDSPDTPRERLMGVISIRDALMASPSQRIDEVMAHEVLCVTAKTGTTEAARLLSKHKFLCLPVTDDEGFLLGIIPAEDLMQFTLAQLYERYSRSVGTDAAAMEKMTPAQAAMTRLPWLLGTMVVELGAGLLIDQFNEVLSKVILLASFMPIISAVSGNVGLQAAAITVRRLDTGDASARAARHALLKEAMTTLFMAIASGIVLALIGGVWSRHLMFGVVIGLALTASMLTAATMGTLFPMVSKRMGFDPATTAGPFETAFQDVVGFGVFLGLATLFADQL